GKPPAVRGGAMGRGMGPSFRDRVRRGHAQAATKASLPSTPKEFAEKVRAGSDRRTRTADEAHDEGGADWRGDRRGLCNPGRRSAGAIAHQVYARLRSVGPDSSTDSASGEAGRRQRRLGGGFAQLRLLLRREAAAL